MTLWRRAPREVYRVYGEDEYLSADEQQVAEHSPSAPVVEPIPGSRSGRLIGIGLLVGITVSAVGLVVLNVAHRSYAPANGADRVIRSDANHRSEASRRSAPIGRQAELPLPSPNHAASASDVSASVLAGEQSGQASGGRGFHVRTPATPVLSQPRRVRRVSNKIEFAPPATPWEPWRSQTSSPSTASSANAPVEGEFDFER